MAFVLARLLVLTLSILSTEGVAAASFSKDKIAAAEAPPAAASSNSQYDYIIVGGGTAGNALATRLSQGLPNAKIVVIEAGPKVLDELGINVPGRKGSTLGTKYDWNFATVPQTGMAGRVIGVNRGKVLGGSSALNLMCHDRASKAEYDAWEEVGNPGWNWASLSEAMTRSETYVGGPPGSGESGPLHAVINRYQPEQQAGFIPAVTAASDIPVNDNSLQGNPIGVMLQPSSIDPAHYNRSYSTNAYLPLAGSNLNVLTDTLVTKVNFNSAGSSGNGSNSLLQATGVTLEDGTELTASKEVILAAGTVQSPLLLEVSGIGNASVLGAAKIPTLVDLPGVGENYQDHLRLSLNYKLKPEFTSFDIFKYNATYTADELTKWLAGNVSRWDYTASAFLFANWNQTTGDAAATARLTTLAQAVAVAAPSDVGLQKQLAFLDSAAVPQVEVLFSDGYTGVKGYPAQGSALYGSDFFNLLGGLMHPLSRGSVHLDPSNPSVSAPVVDPRYLDNEHDVQALVEMAKFIRRVANTEPLRSVWDAEFEPGLDVVPEGASDEAWRAFVVGSTLSIFHPVGTCAMLPRAKGGVVDPALRVYGTRGLRVVDASVFPVQISAHIQTAVYGIAERAADLIIQEVKELQGAAGDGTARRRGSGGSTITSPNY